MNQTASETGRYGHDHQPVLLQPDRAQVLPPAKKAARVAITQKASAELVSDYVTFIRWITTTRRVGVHSASYITVPIPRT